MNRFVRVSMFLTLMAFPSVTCLLAEPNDEGDVRQVVNGFAESWNHHDMEAFGRLFAPDAEFVNVSAVLMKGRQEIQSHHAWSHGTIPESTQGSCCHGAAQQYGAFKNSTMKFDTIDVHFLQKDVAEVHVNWQLSGDARTSTPRRGIFLFVLTRQDGSWLISSAQNTESTESRRQHECANQANLNRTVGALAQSAFDGTWKQRLDSIKITAKPEVFSIVNGTYICSSCTREIKIPADGQDHTLSGAFTLAVTIVDAYTTRTTWKLAGKIEDVTTITVSADGSTLTGAFTNYDGPEPATGTYTEKRVATGPPGAHAVSGSWQMTRINSGNDAQTIMSYEMTADGFRMKQGSGLSYDAKFDGNEYPIVGDLWHTTVTLQRIDDHTVLETDHQKGKVSEEIRLAVAKDGKTIEVVDHDLSGGLAGEQTLTYTLEKQ